MDLKNNNLSFFLQSMKLNVFMFIKQTDICCEHNKQHMIGVPLFRMDMLMYLS